MANLNGHELRVASLAALAPPKIATEAGCALCSENLQQISANLVPSAATDLKSSREQVLVWIFQ